MFILILGGGRIGSSLAHRLVAAGHEVSVIERDPSKCSALDKSIGSVTVLGDGTDVSALSKAGAGRADVFVATTSADEDNISACQLTSLRFGTPRTLTIVNESERARLVDMLRINVSIDITDLAVSRIQEFMFLDGMIQQLPMPGDDTRSLLVARVPRNSAMDGRPVSDLELPNGSSISLLVGRDGHAQVPDGNSVIRSDDEIVAIGDRPTHEMLRAALVEQLGERE